MKLINASEAPAAIGPYSHASRTGNLIYTSGQIPVDPATGALVEDKIEPQTRQALTNLKTVLASESLTLANVVKTTVFITDMAEFPQLNAIYAEYFGDHKPARSTIQVAALPLGCRVEIEAIAEISDQ
jgi:2-iminobutanoate/2-iminopropanoate deaminase